MKNGLNLKNNKGGASRMKNIMIILFIILLCLCQFVVAAERIAIVKSRSLSSYDEAIEGFKETFSMSGLKYDIDILDMKGEDKTAEDIVNQLKNDNDVKSVFTLGARASEMIAAVIKDKPIIFSYVLNWKSYEALKSANVTGVEFEIPANVSLTLFKMIAPEVNKIGIIYKEDNSKEVVNSIKEEVKNQGLELVEEKISSSSDIKKSYKNLLKNKINALWIIADPVLTQDKDNFVNLINSCKKDKIATLTVTDKFVEIFGALFAVAPDYKTIGSQCANMVQNILSGKNLSEIPIEAPMGTINVINKKIADEIGLQFTDFLLRMFNKVYE